MTGIQAVGHPESMLPTVFPPTTTTVNVLVKGLDVALGVDLTRPHSHCHSAVLAVSAWPLEVWAR